MEVLCGFYSLYKEKGSLYKENGGRWYAENIWYALANSWCLSVMHDSQFHKLIFCGLKRFLGSEAQSKIELFSER